MASDQALINSADDRSEKIRRKNVYTFGNLQTVVCRSPESILIRRIITSKFMLIPRWPRNRPHCSIEKATYRTSRTRRNKARLAEEHGQNQISVSERIFQIRSYRSQIRDVEAVRESSAGDMNLITIDDPGFFRYSAVRFG